MRPCGHPLTLLRTRAGASPSASPTSRWSVAEQAHPGAPVQTGCPVYTFNLGGYRVAHMQAGEKGSYTFGGLTDAGFRMLALLDQQKRGEWPF